MPLQSSGYFILALVLVAVVGIFVFTAASNANPASVSDSRALPGEVIQLDNDAKNLTSKNLSIDLSFPQTQPNSKLMTIKNKESALSVFLIDSSAFIFFESPNKTEKVTVRFPISVPVTSNNGVSSFSLEVDEKSQTISIASDVVSHSWTPPQETRDLNFTEIQIGNAQDLDVAINQKTIFDAWLAIWIVLIPIASLIIFLKRAEIRSRSLQMLESARLTPVLGKNLILGTLIAGFGIVAVLPSAPPAGNLVKTSVDAA